MEFKAKKQGFLLVVSFVIGMVAMFLGVEKSYAKSIEVQIMDDPKYWTVGQVELQDLGEVNALVDSSLPTENPPTDDSGEDGISLDKIINAGKAVWEIVKSNKPVVNVKTDSASALPEGVKGWTSLQGWKAPQAHLYRITYKNLYQIKVVDFTFQVLFTHGGNVNGKGKYLCEATIIPASLNVVWGYTFNAEGFVQSILNVGSHLDPIGAVELRLKWSVDTYLKHSENTASFFLQGDGVFVNLTKNP